MLWPFLRLQSRDLRRSGSSTLRRLLASRHLEQERGAEGLSPGSQAAPLCQLPLSGASASHGPGSSGGGGCSNGLLAAASQLQRPGSVGHQAGWQRSFATAASSELAHYLASLATTCGGANVDALSRAVARLPYVRQQQLEPNSPQAAAFLLGLGIEPVQLARLVERCPKLFSWPVRERAQVLFGQLMGLGLSAAEAARCFETQPAAAGMPSFEAAIAMLADLLERGSKQGQAGLQLLAQLLRRQPAAVHLLTYKADTLQKYADFLLNDLGLSPQQVVVAAMQQDAALLRQTPERLEALAALLEEELGVDRRLFCKILANKSRLAGCSLETVQRRVEALVKKFGQEQTLRAVDLAPKLLAVDTAVWRRALAVMKICGVADPEAVAHKNISVLGNDYLAPGRLANRLALQRCMKLSEAEVYERYGTYVVDCRPERLAGRLLYLEQRRLRPLLVGVKAAARRVWREEHGLPADKEATGEPAFISVADVAHSHERFIRLLKPPHGAADFEAFMARLPDSPEWRQLCTEAEAEAARLSALLEPDLRPGAAAAAGQAKEEEGEGDGSAA